MQTMRGDLWGMHGEGHWVCVTTNGVVGSSGLVMGAGIAKEAAIRYPELKAHWGDGVMKHGNVPMCYIPGRLLSFPTKHHWRHPSDLPLIQSSAKKLVEWWTFVEAWYKMSGEEPKPICLPKPGCGNGGLLWSQVEPAISGMLNDNFIVML